MSSSKPKQKRLRVSGVQAEGGGKLVRMIMTLRAWHHSMGQRLITKYKHSLSQGLFFVVVFRTDRLWLGLLADRSISKSPGTATVAGLAQEGP